MRCPRCHAEYEDDVATCADCGIALVAGDAPRPARVDALLGTFHPTLSDRITGLLGRRGVAHDAVPAGGAVEIVVDRAFRDDLRAELAVNWDAIVARLPGDEAPAVLATGGSHPGWLDAPHGAWVDRAGRLQVDVSGDEAAEPEAKRVVGPMLVVAGTVLALFGWYAGGMDWSLVGGLALAGTGLFLPR